ncbi:MAG: ArnT family glycosyltransferase [Planctomycetota bacterium]
MMRVLGLGGVFIMMMALSVLARDGMFSRDGVVFMTLAQRLQEGDLASVLLHPQQPLVPFLIALLGKAGLDPVAAGRMVSMGGLFTALSSLALMIAKRSGRLAGAWAFIFMLATPSALSDGSDVLSDAPYWGFVALGTLLLARAIDTRSVWLGFPAGVLLAASALTRPEGYVMSGALLVFGLVTALCRGESAPGRHRGLSLAVLAVSTLAFCLTIAPYVQALHKVTGDWRLSMKVDFARMAGLDAAFPTTTPARDVMRVGNLSVENSRDEFLESPTPGEQAHYALDQTLFKFLDTLGFVQGLVIFIGLAMFRRSLTLHPEVLFLASVTLVLGAVQWFQDHYLSHRHVMMAALALGSLCGPLGLELAAWCRARQPRAARYGSTFVLVAMCLVALERQGKWFRGEEARLASNKAHLREIGQTLQGRPESYLVGSDCRVAWFSRKQFIEWPRREDPFDYIHREVPEEIGEGFILVLPDNPPHESYSKEILASRLATDGWRPQLSLGGETVYVRD